MPRSILAAFALAMVVVSVVGVGYYQREHQRLQQQVENQLQAIAKLKVNQIADWRSERLGGAHVLADSEALAAGVDRWLSTGADDDREAIVAQLQPVKAHYRYADVLVTDLNHQVRLSLAGAQTPLGKEGIAACEAALRLRTPVLSELHAGLADGAPHLDVVAPLFRRHDGGSRAVGTVILRIDASQLLYPLIQSWPTPSRTAETLLVRRDGDDVVFLNELRHRQSTALKLRIPLTQQEVPAVMAVLGRRGVFLGSDYRGEEVLSALMPVADSGWFIVAKVDTSEALAEPRRQSRLTLAFLLGLLASMGAMGALVWQRNAKAHYRELYRSEATRRQVEERHRATLLSVGDGVIAADAHGCVEMLNPVAEALTGWTNEEARGKPVEEVFRIVNEDTGRPVESPVRRVVREGTIVGLANHTMLISKGGEQRPIADSGAPIRDADGTIAGVVMVFRDQTDARRAEEALRARARLFQQLFTDSLLPQLLVDPLEGRILDANGAAAAFYGWSVERLTSMRMADIDPSPPDRLRSDMARALRRDTGRFLVQHSLASGERRWVEVNSGPIRRDDKDLLLSFIVDVTERMAAEAGRRRLSSLLERSVNEVFCFDAKTLRFTYANPAALRNLGMSLGEITALTPVDIKPEFTAEAFEEVLAQVREGKGAAFTFETVHRRKDGSAYAVEIELQLLDGDEGQEFLAIASDITDRLRSEQEQRALHEQLQVAQKMEAVGRLAGGVAHDFNNLLTIINASASFAIDEVDEGSPARADLEEIRAAGNRAATLTRQLLAFSRRQLLEPEVLNLNNLLGNMEKMVRRLIGEDINFSVRFAEDLGSVRADPGQLEQVVMNLVVNARDAMPEGGVLTVSTANADLDEQYAAAHVAVTPGRYVMLSVSDTGQGMDEATRTQVFDPFFTTKEKGKGTGLGLSTVYGIVKQSGGNVWVYSEVGQGSTFKVYLPRVEDQPPDSRRRSTAVRKGGGETILVVEDEDGVRRLAARILTRAGYNVLSAATAAEALRICEDKGIALDLLLTDVVMPEMSGKLLTTKALAIRPQLKVIYMSGYTDDAIVHHGVLDPGTRFISKPFTAGELEAKVREALYGGDEAPPGSHGFT